MIKSNVFLLFLLFPASLQVNLKDVYFNTINVAEPCLSYSSNLSVIGSQFIQCTLNNARPLTICKNCLQHYLEFKRVYNLMSNDEYPYATTLYKGGLTCKNIIESGDKVQADYQLFSLITNIWTNAFCDTCFESYSLDNGTLNYTFTNSIIMFEVLHKSLVNCIYNVTEKIVPLDPIFDDYCYNSTLCKTCKEHYVNLTNHFNSMGDENSFCMDVVNTANYTRIVWSKGYKCNYKDPDEMNCLMITGIFTFISSSFYILMKIFGRKEPTKKAKIFRRKSSFFGHQISSE